MTVSAFPSLVSAHSSVSPSQTATSKYETFSVSVPTEREVSTIDIVLDVPVTLDRVTPFVKPGWRVSTTKDADDRVTQIRWTGGAIPEGQKDTFAFTARTPAEDGTLIWKVYQTYADGERVAWDQDPAGHGGEHDEEEVTNPYSVTDVAQNAGEEQDASGNTSLILSIIALLASGAALWMSSRKQA